MNRNEPPHIPQPLGKPAQSPSIIGLPPAKIELPSRAFDEKSSLDDMFVRLSSATSSVPSGPAGELPKAGLDKPMFIFDDRASDNAANAAAPLSAPMETLSLDCPALTLPVAKPLNAEPTEMLRAAQQSTYTSSLEGDEHEAVYLRKAADYLEILPTSPGEIVHNIKGVAKKLHIVYAPDPCNTQ